jgi:hypothetical protein
LGIRLCDKRKSFIDSCLQVQRNEQDHHKFCSMFLPNENRRIFFKLYLRRQDGHMRSKYFAKCKICRNWLCPIKLVMCTDNPRRKPRNKWQDIKIGIHEIRWGIIWIYVAQGRDQCRRLLTRYRTDRSRTARKVSGLAEALLVSLFFFN